MKKSVFTIILLIGCIAFSTSQSGINDYKYVIVPNKYEFLKEADKYQLNSLTKFLFNKYGFTAIMEDESLTDELLNNRCLALTSNVINSSGLFKTKLSVELRNCKDEVVFLTHVGETREKDYAKAFNFALRDAFESFLTVNYSYKPNEQVVTLANNTNTAEQKEVEKLKEEIKALKKEKETQVEVIAKIEKESDEKEIVNKVEEVKPVIEKKAEVKEEVKPALEKIEQPQPKQIAEEKPQVQSEASNMLYAQPIDNGFQLVDSSPKVVYKIKRSGTSDMYFVEGKQAIIYKSGSDWILEYYENDTLKKEFLKIKF